MTPSVHHVPVNDARLHVEVHGPAGAPALVVLHGAPGLADCRSYVRDYVSLADEFRLVFYDARGSGRSELRPPYTHEQWVADLDELTRQLQLDTFALLGHSYGGIVAQEYAVAHPERLSRLVLLDTTPSTLNVDEIVQAALDADVPEVEEGWVRKLFAGRVESDEEMRWMCERLVSLNFEGPVDPELIQLMTEDTYVHFATHNASFGANNPRYDVRPHLPDVRVPTLVMCGARDWICPREKSETIASLIPGSRLEVFEQSGHMPNAEESQRLIDVLRSFLRSTTGAEQ